MKKSELIAQLQTELEITGDEQLLSYKIVDAGGGRSGFLYSPTRRMQNGQRAKMNFKEYRDFLLDERIKKGGRDE